MTMLWATRPRARAVALSALLALSAIQVPRAEGVGTLVYVVLRGSDSYNAWASPDGLSLMHPDGSNQVPLTSGSADTEPTWSPDGSSIAFSRSSDIYVIPAVGGAPLNLTNHPANDSAAAWSPDGQRIAFASDRGGPLELYLMNADGSGVARLTGSLASTGHLFRVATSRVVWAQDGSALAFTCAIESGNSDICTIKVDGSSLTRLTTDPGRDSDPGWSPDGGTIAFATERYGTTFYTGDGEVWPVTDIALMNSDGSGVRRLSAGIAAEYPSWSPDGARIAFDVLEYFDWWGGAYMNVSVLNMDGSGVITPAASGSSAAWRPPAGNLPPRASFFGSCGAHACSFDAASSADPDGSIATYRWDFGDGTTGSGATTSHIYPTGNPYVATLTITDDSGASASVSRQVEPNNRPIVWGRVSCTGVTCAFDASEAHDPDGTIISRVWEFGDGSSAAGAKVSHTYGAPSIHHATVTVTDNEGATATNTVYVVASTYPVASFTSTCSRLTCVFDASASSDADGTIATYVWHFGDGTSAAGPTVSHTYASGRTYYVMLDVRDNLGLSGFLQRYLTVAPTAPPLAAFTSACSDLACAFDGSGSSAAESTITSYQWDFGDGSSSSFDPTVSYTYRAPGTYSVVLTVRDSFGVSDEQRTNVIVTSVPAHVGDIDGVANRQGAQWGATVTIEVHGENHSPLANVRVSGSLAHGAMGECITAANGRCAIQFGGLPKQARSTSFSVVSVSQPGSYKSEKNHDPDGDSNGTTIVVRR